MQTLLHGAKVFYQNQLQDLDILLSDGRIVSIRKRGDDTSFDQVLSFSDSFVITPGFVDVHVHLREPGFSYKETIQTGTLAGAAGGYTDLCAMPNLDPVPDSPEHLQVERDAIKRNARVHVYPYGALTVGRKGVGECADYAGMQSGVIGYSDDGTGIQDDDLMLKIMLAIRPMNRPIAAHCEFNHLLNGGYIHDGSYAAINGHKGISSASEYAMIDRDLQLVEKTGCRYHVCHVSTKESVALIRRAKEKGLPVTCETAPHYLLLTDMDMKEEGRFKMNPPLRSPEDRDALLEGLLDGTIDVIATDHAPHAREEKSQGLAGSAMGITGLETAFPVLYTNLVRTHRVSLEFLLDKMITAPRRIFGIAEHFREGELFQGNLLQLDQSYSIDSKRFFSMGKSTPFDGWTVYGKNRMTWIDGKCIWSDWEEQKWN